MATRTQRESRQSRYSDAKEVEKNRKVFSRDSLKLPPGVELFRVRKADTYRFDILPFEAGADNPAVKKGKLHYERTFWSHSFVGPGSATVCCLAKNWNESCPVCDYLAREFTKAGDDEDTVRGGKRKKQLARMTPKQRQLWIIVDRSKPEEPPGKVKVFEESFHLFGKQLKAKIDGAEPGDGYENFFHLEDGMTLRVLYDEKPLGDGGKCLEAMSIEMKQRKPYGDEWLEKVPCLDDVINRLSQDELKELLYGSAPDEDGHRDAPVSEKPPARADDEGWDTPPARRREPEAEEPAAPARRPRRESPEPEPAAPEAEKTAEELGITLGCTVEHDKYGDCKVVHVSGDGSALRLENRKGDVIRAVNPNDCKPVDDVPPEKPAPRRRPAEDAAPARRPTARKEPEPPEPADSAESWDEGDIPFDDEPADEPEAEKPQRRRGR